MLFLFYLHYFQKINVLLMQLQLKFEIYMHAPFKVDKYFGENPTLTFQVKFIKLLCIILLMSISVGNSLSVQEPQVKQEVQQIGEYSRISEAKDEVDKTSSSYSTGHWSPQENLLYMIFLNAHKLQFKCRLRRKKIRLFEKMSEFIGTRSSIQCRTHHQKYENKFGEATNILRVYRESIGKEQYKILVKRFTEKAKNQSCSKAIIKQFQKLELNQSLQRVEMGTQINNEQPKQAENIPLQTQQQYPTNFYYYCFVPFIL